MAIIPRNESRWEPAETDAPHLPANAGEEALTMPRDPKDKRRDHPLWERFPEVTDRIKTLEEAAEIAARARSAGRTVVTLNGSFDLLHAGHLNIIREARSRGDLLMVGMNSDESYRRYKDPRGPVVPESQRAALLAALVYVDYVVLFDEPDPVVFLSKVRPSIHCNGAEYGEDCMEADTVKSAGGVVVPIPELSEEGRKVSTSGLLDRIAERCSAPRIKAVILDRDGIINEDAGFVYRVEDFRFRPGIVDLLRDLGLDGYGLFVITNQSGIARGMYTEDDVRKLHEHMLAELSKEGIEIRDIYVCPHHPEGTVPRYSLPCDCRKPHSMLFQRARKEHHIDVAASWSLGDRLRDCEAAKRAGFRTILLKSPSTPPEECESPSVDRCVVDLAEVRGILLE